MERIFSFCRIPPGGFVINFSTSPVLYRARAPYDRVTKLITLISWVGLIFLNLFIMYQMIIHEAPLELFITITFLLLTTTFGILIGTFLFSPRGYEITLDGIVVKRYLGSFKIPYDRIIDARRVKWTWKGMRLCASGGLHGFFGLFKIAGVGNVWMYVKNRSKMILIKTVNGTQYVISPEDPDEFLRKLGEISSKEGMKIRKK